MKRDRAVWAPTLGISERVAASNSRRRTALVAPLAPPRAFEPLPLNLNRFGRMERRRGMMSLETLPHPHCLTDLRHATGIVGGV